MSSTDTAGAPPNTPRAPLPLTGILPDQLEQAIRAYTRRAGMLRGGTTLRALKAVDQRLDALMDACRYYGAMCLPPAAKACAQALPTDRLGAAFVVLALNEAYQPDWTQRRALLLQFLPEFPTAVRDALWFFAAEETCPRLLSEPDGPLLALGIELAGRLALPAHLPAVYQAAQGGADEDDCLLACARMGQLPEHYQTQLTQVLQGQDLPRQIKALETLSVCGQPILHEPLMRYITRLTAADGPTQESHPHSWAAAADAAMALWTLRQPEQALNACIKGLRVPHETAMRVIALAGRIEGLVHALHYIENQDRPVDPAERDILQLVFGKVPAELTCTPGSQTERIQALRQLACEVFNRNGCTDLDPQQISTWTDPKLQDQLWPLTQIRLRNGHPHQAIYVLAAAFDISHALRRWLYAEYASIIGIGFPLAFDDITSRQVTAIESVLLLRSMELDAPPLAL